ncbi:MAG: hypothetical protein ACRCY9_15770, partial [Phycicoccus sp.]
MSRSLFAVATAVAVVTTFGVGTAHAAPPEDCPATPDGLLFQQDFERFPAGTPALEDERDVLTRFCPPIRWASGFGNDAEPPASELSEGERSERASREAAGQFNGASDTVRVAFDDGVAGAQGQALRVLYPKGTNTSSHSGAQFEMPIPGVKTYDRDSGDISPGQ